MEALLQDLPALTCSEFGVLKTTIVLAIFESGHPSASDILKFVEKHRDLGVRADDVTLRAVRYALLLLQRDSYVQRHVLAEDDVYTIDPRWRQHVEKLYKTIQAKLVPKRPPQPEITVEDVLRQQAVSVDVTPATAIRQRMPQDEDEEGVPDLMTQTIYIPRTEQPPVEQPPAPPSGESTPVVAPAQASQCIII